MTALPIKWPGMPRCGANRTRRWKIRSTHSEIYVSQRDHFGRGREVNAGVTDLRARTDHRGPSERYGIAVRIASNAWPRAGDPECIEEIPKVEASEQL